MRRALRRLDIFPFDALIAAFAVLSGLLGLLHVGMMADALALLLPGWVTLVFQWAYLVAGVMILTGIALGAEGPWIFGLILVGTSVIVRVIALGWLVGWTELVAGSYAFNAMVLLACASRTRQLFHGSTYVRMDP